MKLRRAENVVVLWKAAAAIMGGIASTPRRRHAQGVKSQKGCTSKLKTFNLLLEPEIECVICFFLFSYFDFCASLTVDGGDAISRVFAVQFGANRIPLRPRKWIYREDDGHLLKCRNFIALSSADMRFYDFTRVKCILASSSGSDPHFHRYISPVSLIGFYCTIRNYI